MTIKLSEAENESKNLKRKLEREEKEYVLQERRLEDFETLQELYSGYLKNRHEAERLSREIERLNRRMKLSMQSLEEMDDRWKSLEIEKEEHSQKIKDSRSKLLLYTEYEDENCKDVPAASVICDAEARYQAITSKFSAEIQLLEEQAAGAGKRLDKAENRLKNLQEKYGLKREDWEEAAYSAKEEKHQEELLQEKERSCEKKKELFYDEDTNVKVIAQQVKDRISELRNKVQKEVPLPKKEIRTTDFQAKLKELEYQLKEVREDREAWERKERSYGENLTALEEFADDRISEPIEWEKNFREMTQKKLREFSGLLVRDYRESVKECQEKRNRFVDFLNKILRMEIFQDPFYRQPLEHMLELNAQAEMAVSQLNTTLSSYDRLMEKLEVDISMVEKEKAKIVELLDDYLYEVHENIGRIDSNSTITIREKPVKMLKIQLPDWEKNAGLYRVRLNDFIDELTQKGLEIFDKNENALEYFGSRMTTKNLYDQVVGIANVQIRLYKVEEQREYPITWAEVAKNSGGEGFLSAFIILTSLLYYMRKDETDLFAEKNEGKVLVMDNPFAQTNAAHLLKPLMDMAKKTNTQLICLSGLGGDSIYSRFDNIYVLNLVAANLRGGMQYLRADHKRGSEPDTMILSRIEVMNQEELIF